MTNYQVRHPQKDKPKFFYGYTIVSASFLILMAVFGAQFSFGVFFKPVLTEFDWTRAATAGAYSLNMILMGAFSIIAGRLNDRFGPRLVVTVSGLILGLGYFLMSQINSIWQIYLFYGVLVSIGAGGCWVPLLSTVARWFVKKRGAMSGIVTSGIGFGIIIMPPLANQLISTYSWRISYIIFGLIALVVTVIIAQFLRRDPSHSGLLAYGANSVTTDSPNLGIKGLSLREAIRTSQFWIICVIFLCAGVSIHTVLVHLVPHATDIGVSPAAAAAILSVAGIISIGGKVGIGSIIDRIRSKRVMIIALVLMSLSFLWMLFASELWMLYLFVFVFSLGYGGFVAGESPTVAEYFGLRAHGAILGIAVFGFQIGSAIGALVPGSIFDSSGSYYWAFILCAILGVAGLILLQFLKATNSKK